MTISRAPDSDSRVALVTGAARGIGAAVVRRLICDGYRVTAIDWCVADTGPVPYRQAEPAELEALAAEAPEHIEAVIADVRDLAALHAAAAETVRRWGRIDAVVAAAAVIVGGAPLWETPSDDAGVVWDIDVGGVWNTAAVTIPHLLTSPDPTQARFVAIASAAADHGLFGLSAYNAAKHGVIGMVKGLAADLVGTGVTATAVSPGSTRTRMLEATAALYGLGDVEEFAKNQLTRRLLEPDEVAAAVSFCASPTGGVINGTILHADGGFMP